MRLNTLHPDADAEVTEAARYYESRQPGLGSDLLKEVEQAFDYISTKSSLRGRSPVIAGGIIAVECKQIEVIAKWLYYQKADCRR